MNNILRASFVAVLGTVFVLGAAWSVFHFKSFTAATAAAPFEITGYAWSETIGWISMQGSLYSVTIKNNLELEGYAWSENIGWIKFNGLSGCPQGTCTARVEAESSSFELSGWARAMAYTDPEAGGWDGWISLNCENTNSCGTSEYAIRITDTGTVVSAANQTGSFAWGSTNIGWLDFGTTGIANTCTTAAVNSCSGANSVSSGTTVWCAAKPLVSTPCPNGCNSTTGLCNTVALTGTITISPLVVRRNSNVTIAWTVPAASGCTLTGPNGLSVAGVSGSETVAITLNQSTFTLTCDGIVLDTETVRLVPNTYEV